MALVLPRRAVDKLNDFAGSPFLNSTDLKDNIQLVIPIDVWEPYIGSINSVAQDGRINTNDFAFLKAFLVENNKGGPCDEAVSRTILLMDATGSMGSLLEAVKDTVCQMFELAALVLKEKGFTDLHFQMQFAFYRDYDCRETILQTSAWETKALNLRQFISKPPIAATGGGDYEEAIEIGLWHAVKESKHPEGLSQVILIGDAPAKERTSILEYRRKYGGEAYWTAKFGSATHFVEQAKLLKAAGIPVHPFYLASGAKANFEAIASMTGGTCRALDIRSSNGAQQLTDFVTEEILRKSAGSQGEEVVLLFRKKYAKSFLG